MRQVRTSGYGDDRGEAHEMADMRAERQRYVRTVLSVYTRIQTVAVRVRRSDRQLAGDFFDRQVPLTIVEAAVLLGAARRIPGLPAIRSLHYFEPIVQELLAQTPPAAYIDYLRQKLPAARPLSSGKQR